MFLPPSHIGRSAEEIISDKLHFDSAGYLYRAASWVDHYKNNRYFPALIYACTEARHGIEYLLFEELILSTGATLSEADYQRCVKERNRFIKMIKQLSPDYNRLQEFTSAVAALTPGLPKLIYWDHNELVKCWGIVSNYLHWFGAKIHTTEDKEWEQKAYTEIKGTIDSIWRKLSSGQSGILHPDDMKPRVKEVWEEFKEGKMDLEGAKIRLEILQPLVI
jgi:hypothetical protein